MELTIKIWGLEGVLKEPRNCTHVREWCFELHFSRCLLLDIILVLVENLP